MVAGAAAPVTAYNVGPEDMPVHSGSSHKNTKIGRHTVSFDMENTELLLEPQIKPIT